MAFLRKGRVEGNEVRCDVTGTYRREESIRWCEKFLSSYKEIMDAQYFSFCIILSNYVRSILFYRNKNHDVRQIRFRVCMKMRRCKRRICKRKTFLGQPNT